jgi:4-diphosphocytidyl-2-C-methyl-D-erythritol kinase
MVKLLTELAPAKINLFLRVVGRRPDGYHELDSVFVPISFYDQLRMELRTASHASVALRCAGADDLPTDDRNLAVRAAKAFMAEFGVKADVLIDLRKEIPAGAGLGGGSSDAAAVLRIMAALLRVEADPKLAALALKLGADVPFFLHPAPARVEGIGERISPLPKFASLALAIAVPSLEVSTATIYRELRPHQWSGKASENDLIAVSSGRISPEVLVNDLEPVVMARHAEVASLKAMLMQMGAQAASMSGSGGAVFGVFGDAKEAEGAVRQLRHIMPKVRAIAANSIRPDKRVPAQDIKPGRKVWNGVER